MQFKKYSHDIIQVDANFILPLEICTRKERWTKRVKVKKKKRKVARRAKMEISDGKNTAIHPRLYTWHAACMSKRVPPQLARKRDGETKNQREMKQVKVKLVFSTPLAPVMYNCLQIRRKKGKHHLVSAWFNALQDRS